jgi:hypothetical protein
VKDLTGRSGELEREAANLRRENSWLREIVMLKGAQYAASSQTHREALRQAAVVVTSGQIPGEKAEEESEDDRNSKGKQPARTGKKT